MTKILCVEDNDNNVYLLSMFFGRLGFEMVCAGDGGEGVAMARSEKPDVILMDLNLPVVDGWEAARRIKAEPETAAIPIIAASAHSEQETIDRALGADFDDFATKPLDLKSLLLKIRALVPAAGTREAPR